MNKYTFLTALLALVLHTHGNCQGFAAPVKYNNGVPTAPPSNNGSRIYVDMLTGFRYNWNQSTSTWQKDADGVLQIAGASAPLAAPGYGQPRLAMNNPLPPARPDLYVWIGPGNTDWACLSCVESVNVNAGTGIAVTGTPPNITVTNTAPNTNQSLSLASRNLTISGGNTVTLPNDLQTISRSGQTVSLSQSGGSFNLPILDVVAGADISVSISGGVATVSGTGGGNGIYGGSGTVPDGTVAGVGEKGGLEFGGDDPDKIALAWRDAVAGINQVVSVGAAGIDFRAEYDDGVNPTQSVIFGANSSTASFASDKSAIEFNTKGGVILFSAPDVALIFDDTGAAPEFKINDDRSVPNGLVYSGDYSDAIIANDPSLTDVRTVKKMLGSSTTVTGATSALANAAAATAGVPVGGPYRWDDGSTIILCFRR